MQHTDVTIRISLKRVYDKPSTKDGFRVLVDRLWPRGVKKENATIGLWCKDIAPSNDLRKWFGHNPAKWNEFKSRYFKELDTNREAVSLLVEKACRKPLTLLFSAKDKIFNNATVLMEYIKKNSKQIRPFKQHEGVYVP
jgi:uncharacterized protein YeaO (DUF488 family)